MNSEKIAVGADHAGYRLKERLRDYLSQKGYAVEDVGTDSEARADYPDFAEQVAIRVANGNARFGVLVCGTGLGMTIAANKVVGVRATTCTDTLSASLSRSHNDANVLALGSRTLDEATARNILDVWLNTSFAAGRHQKRVAKIETIERHSRKE